MFLCDFCNTPSGPRIKPNVVVMGTRPQEYENLDLAQSEEEGVKVYKRTSGTEITAEARSCPNCDKQPRYKEVVPNYSSYRAFARGVGAHASGCQKPISECKICKRNVDYFQLFPLPALSAALRDFPAQTQRFSFALGVFGSVADRSFHNSKRGKMETIAALQALGEYESRGGRL